jgi:uncharacterized coiled-coil DUF342 family protein
MHFVCFRDEKINNLEEQMSSLKDEATRMETERTDLLAKVRYFTLIFTEVITERTDLLAKHGQLKKSNVDCFEKIKFICMSFKNS